jgi:imidazolonepropionase-like amidohydrolase
VRFAHYYNTKRYHRLPGDLKAAIRSFMREIRWIKVVVGDGAAHPKNAKRQGGVERSDEVKIPN